MEIDSPKVAFERIEGYEDVVRIPLANLDDSQFILDVLKDTFDACFEEGETKFIVDLENVQFPSSVLIALLVEVTSKARRMGGDVKVVNLSNTLKNQLTGFSPLDYLSISNNEAAVLLEFQEKEPEMPEETPEMEEEALPEADIVDDPIIERLQDSFDGTSQKPKKRKGDRNHLRVKSSTSNLYTICDFVIQYAERAGFNTKEIGKAKIAVYEACLNVIEHAYHSNPDNWIDVWIEYNTEIFKIIIQDYGKGFEGFGPKKYDVVSAMDGRQTGGFGLYIIRRSMDELDYRPDAKHGNRLTMIKYLSQE